ncbi:MAG: ROK family protein [Candidatus Eisenbacteria bacterium]|nr:ROK family protein [Candidatus Eisenbacteria bacterium]
MSSSRENPIAIGVDVGGTYIKVALVAEGPRVLGRRLLPMSPKEAPEAVVARLSGAVRELGREAQIELPSIGIGCAGLIDTRLGIVKISPNLPGWRDTPLAGLLSQELRVKVTLDNDANVFSVAEGFYGAAKDATNAVFVTLGTGVGGGLKLNGEMYTGSCGFAGEIGHVTIDPDGPICSCGNRGCLESFAGSGQIVRRARTLIQEEGKQKEWEVMGLGSLDDLTARDLGEAAKEGNEIAERVFAEAGEYIGIALAGAINLLNPEIVVIGGGVSNAGEPLFRAVKATVTRRAIAPSSKCVEIVPARFGNDAGVIGAAMMVLTSEED